MITRNRAWRAVPPMCAMLCALLSCFALLYPIYVIRPFRHQEAHELAFALSVTRFRPAIEVFCVLAAAAAVVFSWPRVKGWFSKTFLALCALLALVCGLASRVNIYELMFHPLDRAAFSEAAKAKLEGREQVIAVSVHGAARAYPIRSMSYHHIVNDVLGGLPIVATY